MEQPPSRIELLAGTDTEGRSYYLASARIENIDDISGTLSLDECVTDNTTVYYRTGKYEQNEGRTKCNADDPPGFEGSWSFNDDETQLTIHVSEEIQTWDIVNLNDNSHEIKREITSGIITYVMKRIN